MNEPTRIDREAAEELFSRFAPMFADFEERGIDYCLVGGLAVVAHCLVRGSERFRSTEDADAMVAQRYSNADFARDYLRVYAADPNQGKAIYDAVFGDDGFKQLGEAENAFVNISFVGADEDLDGVDTPDFDVCRVLNGRTLDTIERERLTVLGQEVWVATVGELLGMKRDTIAIYGGDPQTSPRPQDFVDVGILGGLATEDGFAADDGSAPPSGLFSRLGRILEGR